MRRRLATGVLVVSAGAMVATSQAGGPRPPMDSGGGRSHPTASFPRNGDALLRVANLVSDGDPIDVYLNQRFAPFGDRLAFGSGTDAYEPFSGYGWVYFLGSGQTDWAAVHDATGAERLRIDLALTPGSASTMVVAGLFDAPGTADHPPIALVLEDELHALPDEGQHALTVFHTAPGLVAPTVRLCARADADADGVVDRCDPAVAQVVTNLDYAAWTPALPVTGGAAILSVELDADGQDWAYELTLPPDGWSYLYLVPDPEGGTPRAIHHVHQAPMVEVLPLVWAVATP